MQNALFTVPVADLDRGEQVRRWSVPAAFLRAALTGSDATPRGTPGTFDATLSKSGREVVVRGTLRAELRMPCARTLDPVDVSVDCPVFLLLAPASPVSPPAGGPNRKKRKGNWKADPMLNTEEAARDVYDGETVVLDSFVREFLLLELPLFPLSSDLHSGEQPAIETPPQASEESTSIDPRLAPLAAIASRLREKKE